MAPWVKRTFVDVLPKYLFIKRPEQDDEADGDPDDLCMMYDVDTSIATKFTTNVRPGFDEQIAVGGNGAGQRSAGNGGGHNYEEMLLRSGTGAPHGGRNGPTMGPMHGNGGNKGMGNERVTHVLS